MLLHLTLLGTSVFQLQVWCLTPPSVLWPAAIPLAVRSPYLNSYLDTHSGGNHTDQWPLHWTEQHVLGWQLLIRVDGNPMQLFGGYIGNATNLTNLKSVSLTPTRTILGIQAGPMDVNVTFLSPIEPNDLVQQSFPFTYLYVDAVATDGQQHDVQFYTDITGEWLSNSEKTQIRWNTTQTSSLLYHQINQASPSNMTEQDNIAMDSTVYFATSLDSSVSYQTGSTNITWAQWIAKGDLSDNQDHNFRAIGLDDNIPVFAFSYDAGKIFSTQATLVCALGLIRNPSIMSGQQKRYTYYWTKYDIVDDGITDFIKDFSSARKRAEDLDKKILSVASSISTDYADLVSLAARQTLASTEVTVSQTDDGRWNMSDIRATSSRTNPVDVIYAAFPTFLYFNTSWAGYLLYPLLDSQYSASTPSIYAVGDLEASLALLFVGASFPTASELASTSPDESVMNTADMIIMAWMHSTYSGDGSLLSRYYSLLKTWTDYLANTNVADSSFIDADGLTNANLGLKSAIAIACMGKIAGALGEGNDESNYQGLSESRITTWKGSASGGDHIVSKYGDDSTWSLVYNLFADRLLQLGLVSDDVYSAQDAFYLSQVNDGKSMLCFPPGNFGIPYDSTQGMIAKSQWMMLTAGATQNVTVRDRLVGLVHQKATSNSTAGVFPTTYNTGNGSTVGGQASPAQGSVFALLALNLTTQSVEAPTGSDGSSLSSSSSTAATTNVRAIVGGVVGGITLTLMMGVLLCWRHRKQRKTKLDTASLDFENQYSIVPFTPESLYMAPHSSPPSENSKFPRPVPMVTSVQALLPHSKRRRPSSEPEPEPAPAPAPAPAPDPEVDVRREVESLRREVEAILAQQAPPEYVFEGR
ncbi:hypothetical protein DFS33DRAFT_1377847 [Desarmillaria ectypa]|nr:hypothetical protein DFS33DRAFT_1377847 [Desarmillaria ectypa]